jgi:hypothetical protein
MTELLLAGGHRRREPESLHIWSPWLPETHENSNYILLRIPVEISNSARGEKAFFIAEVPLHVSLPLSPAAIARLQDCRLIRLPRPVRARRLPIDYVELQQSYRRMLADDGFVSQADLARHLGVSRVWVSRVMKGIKREEEGGRGSSP